MSNKNDKWSALSLKDRADLMNMYLTNGIKELSEMKRHYNGIPYRDFNTSDYDYFNASPEMIPTEEGQHWDSRNPHTGQILKSENHPTFDLAVEGEKNAGYKIVRGYDGNLYSIPNQPDNYVENPNILDGDEKEQTLSGKKPTLEEFIQAKADSTRNAAFEKSKNRKTGVKIPYKASKEYLDGLLFTITDKREIADTNFVGPSIERKELVKNGSGNINYYKKAYYNALEEYKDKCDYGYNCIGTATDNYPEDSRTVTNEDFYKNYNKYGFVRIPFSEVKEGDIVQDNRHALIYSGQDEYGSPLFNYSRGGITEFDYVKNGHYPSKNYIVSRYVGTPELIQQWTEEYNTNNNKKHGGKLNKFATGGPIGEGQKTYNHPKYNHAEEAEMYSYLRSRGVPHVQASAIMGNIAVESMLNPEITQIGGGGGYGLIQATDRSRKKAFINYDGQPYEFGSNISPETQRQLDYIIDKGLNTQTRGEWRGNHNIGRASVARRKFLEATDVNKASTIFTENYLRPGKPHTKRRKSMSNYFNDNYGITERALEEFENSFLFQNN